jgi:hypothetical protein
VGLWGVADLIKTRGKGYTTSEGDGLAYSYSVFDSIPTVKKKFHNIYLMNTMPSGVNMYRSASQVAVFANRFDVVSS